MGEVLTGRADSIMDGKQDKVIGVVHLLTFPVRLKMGTSLEPSCVRLDAV